jgi:hypothetical protein
MWRSAALAGSSRTGLVPARTDDDAADGGVDRYVGDPAGWAQHPMVSSFASDDHTGSPQKGDLVLDDPTWPSDDPLTTAPREQDRELDRANRHANLLVWTSVGLLLIALAIMIALS